MRAVCVRNCVTGTGMAAGECIHSLQGSQVVTIGVMIVQMHTSVECIRGEGYVAHHSHFTLQMCRNTPWCHENVNATAKHAALLCIASL